MTEPLAALGAVAPAAGRRGPGPERSGAAIGQVARDFEAVFLRQLLRDLRKTASVDGESTPMTTGLYQDLFDEHLAEQLARAGGIGLADVLRTYLEQGRAR